MSFEQPRIGQQIKPGFKIKTQSESMLTNYRNLYDSIAEIAKSLTKSYMHAYYVLSKSGTVSFELNEQLKYGFSSYAI